jgi:hypothetical protein
MFTLRPFETKIGSICNISTRIVFLIGQVFFVLEWPNGKFVSFYWLHFVHKNCNDPPPMTQYCPLLAPPNQTSQEVTYPGIALAEARLTAEF